MSINWTKSWSASDDGSILGGNDLGVLQNDISTYTVGTAGTQTVTGNKTFNGTVDFNNTVKVDGDVLPSASNMVFFNDEIVAHNDEIIYLV